MEFVTAAARDPKLRAQLVKSLGRLRAETAKRLGDQRMAAVAGAVANGASIEALIFGEAEGSATFDAAIAALMQATK